MRYHYIIFSGFILIFTSGMILGTLADEQVIEGWTAFHILGVLLAVIIIHIFLYRSSIHLNLILRLLGIIYITSGCILVGTEYYITTIRGFGLIGYILPMLLFVFGISGMFLGRIKH